MYELWISFQLMFHLQRLPSRDLRVRYYPPHILFARTASALVRILLLRFTLDISRICGSDIVETFAYT